MIQVCRTPLWIHQIEALDRFTGETGTLNAWEMGTGKTLFAIERDLRLRLDGVQKTLIVAPMSTHEGWKKAYLTEDPDLNVKVINPKKRDWLLNGEPDVCIVHYEVLGDRKTKAGVSKGLVSGLDGFAKGFDHVVFDECHRLKNRNAGQTKAAKKVKAEFITDMSGSPVTNKPQDIWSVLNHLKPKEFTSYWSFFHKMTNSEREWITDRNGNAIQAQYWTTHGPSDLWLTDGLDSIEHFYDRRLAKDCPNLDYARRPTVETTIGVELTPAMRKAYNNMREEMITWIKTQEDLELPLVAPVVIARLMRLQQLATAKLVYEGDKVAMSMPSPKISALIEKIIDTDEPVLVFSQWKTPLYLMAKELKRKGVSCAMYTGDQDGPARNLSKKLFIEGKAQVLAATIGAGGEGVDGFQHTCRTVAFIDRDWSPLKNDQAIARLNRGGQERTVHIIDVVANNTVDAERRVKIDMKKETILKTLGDI